MSKRKSILETLSKSLPDNRPITSLQIIENLDKCPSGFYPICRTYDQDQDADLWRESTTFLKKKSLRYLCLSKTEGRSELVMQKLIVLSDKAIPPDGYHLHFRTADSEQKAWRKKQLCYLLVNRNSVHQAVTDIIICSRLKKAPEGFNLAGEINGVIICYKMGNVQDSHSNLEQSHISNGQTNSNGKAPSLPPRPTKPGTYPNLNEDLERDYEILNPNFVPKRPAPKPPTLQHQTSTLSHGNGGLDGVPFVVNPRFSRNNSEKLQIPMIKARTMSQLMKEYNYDFRLERQTVR